MARQNLRDLQMPDPPSVKDIRETSLPEPLTDLVEEYNAQIGDRSDFIWKWVYRVAPVMTLDCVADSHAETVREQKVVGVMFNILLDDLAEVYQDRETFREARKIPFPAQSPTPDRDEVRTNYLNFTATVWETLENTLQEAPRAAEFWNLFEFDWRKSINAMAYSYLVNTTPALTNSTEVKCYAPHNMMLLVQADIDLMHSPQFNHADLNKVRQTVWQVQQLGGIGNWITTWWRELQEGDIGAGIFAKALEEGVITLQELEESRDDTRVRNQIKHKIDHHQLEDMLLEEWGVQYQQLQNTHPTANSVDLDAYVDGLRTLLTYQREAQGSK